MAVVGEPREGYELWHPNREHPSSQSVRAICVFLFLVAAGLILVITFGGWERLEGGGGVAIGFAALFVLFAFMTARWRRGGLPLGASFATILLIFAGLAAPAWFSRDKDGLASPALNESFLGLVTILLIPVLTLLIVFALVGFNQAWNVEEERPIAGHPPHDDTDPGLYEDEETPPPFPA